MPAGYFTAEGRESTSLVALNLSSGTHSLFVCVSLCDCVCLCVFVFVYVFKCLCVSLHTCMCVCVCVNGGRDR